MSIERTAVIVRGFYLSDPVPNYEKFPESFLDNWIIDFNYWIGGPYIVGYQIKTCEEGCPEELGSQLGDPLMDALLLKACEEVGLSVEPIKTYFGVIVS